MDQLAAMTRMVLLNSVNHAAAFRLSVEVTLTLVKASTWPFNRFEKQMRPLLKARSDNRSDRFRCSLKSNMRFGLTNASFWRLAI